METDRQRMKTQRKEAFRIIRLLEADRGMGPNRGAQRKGSESGKQGKTENENGCGSGGESVSSSGTRHSDCSGCESGSESVTQGSDSVEGRYIHCVECGGQCESESEAESDCSVGNEPMPVHCHLQTVGRTNRQKDW